VEGWINQHMLTVLKIASAVDGEVDEGDRARDHERNLMADLQELLLRVLREVGPEASDQAIAAKMTAYIEALSESDRAEVNEQMLRLTTSTQLAHLREITENESLGAIPEPSPENGGPAGPPG
jgi:hypothetical protein